MAAMRAKERATAALLAVAWMASGCHPALTPKPAAPSPRTPFLVVIIVDQLAGWVADERWPALPVEGGFARLRREGLTVRDMRYGHAVTETAPGHAALFTGATPRVTGIFGNEVVPAPGADPVSILTDAASQLVVAAGHHAGAARAAGLVPARAARRDAGRRPHGSASDRWAGAQCLSEGPRRPVRRGQPPRVRGVVRPEGDGVRDLGGIRAAIEGAGANRAGGERGGPRGRGRNLDAAGPGVGAGTRGDRGHRPGGGRLRRARADVPAPGAHRKGVAGIARR